ncbi:MAG: hypothetical protein JWM33_3775 [Caulobacteraceae bacterium]|nr:hypothetical protein [Caulobacteraceae bacterium]
MPATCDVIDQGRGGWPAVALARIPQGARKRGRGLTGEITPKVAAFDLARLKTRTLEVVLCALEGDTVAEIARFVDASPSTVRRHLAKFSALAPGSGPGPTRPILRHAEWRGALSR